MKKTLFLFSCGFFLFGCSASDAPMTTENSPEIPKEKVNSEAPKIQQQVSETEEMLRAAESEEDANIEEIRELEAKLLVQRARTADFDETQCDELAGNWNPNDNGDLRCFLPVGDSGKSCESSQDCEELCLVDLVADTVGKCQGEVPLRKCSLVLSAPELVEEVCP